MPLSDEYTYCVAFVCVEDIDGSRQPIGTAFLIQASGEEPNTHYGYAVTAQHVVREGQRTWLRLRRQGFEEGPEDIPVGSWVLHPESDVAITPCDPHNYRANWVCVPMAQFADTPGATGIRRPVLSDEVWFIGLLTHVPTMHERAIPFVRSGTLGAWYQRYVPIWDELHQQTIQEPVAHLIDTHSVGGFSGSPVFVGVPDMRGGGKISLLGVLIGHFGGPLASGGSAGVAIVVPVEQVRQLLDLEVIVEDRQHKDAETRERRTRDRDENAAVQDIAAVPSEFERFEELTRQLVNTPKPKG
ncbi:MAG: hypothetical protein ACRDJX_08765 [Solirubrobacteraceae bacterium]